MNTPKAGRGGREQENLNRNRLRTSYSFSSMKLQDAHRTATAIFKKRGWKVFKFQRDTWDAYASGESGLVHAPTGTGKTYAVWIPPLVEWMTEQDKPEQKKQAHPNPRKIQKKK